MKTDQELEQLLRSTFAGRAGTVDDAVAPQQSSRRRTWLPALAAAAAVAVIAGGVVVGARLTHDSRPARPSPTPRPTTHGTPAPHSVQALRCTAALPAAWQHAVSTGTVAVPGKTLTPLAVTDAGDVLADEAAAVAVPHTHKLVLVSRGKAVRTLYGKQPPASWNGMRIGDVSTDGNWVAFALAVQAQSGGQGPEQIELVNITTGRQRTLRPTTPNDATIIEGPAIAGGSVYWTEIDAAHGLETGHLYRYDIATAKRSTIDSGLVSAPLASGSGISWTKDDNVVTARAGSPTPPGFDLAAAIRKDAPLFVDGRAAAWLDTSTMSSIKVSDGDGAPVTVVPADRGGRPSGLTGDFLWWSGSVLDLRTGAATSVGSLGLAHGPTAAISLSGGRLAVLDTSELPALHC